jgi:hypothetical protein
LGGNGESQAPNPRAHDWQLAVDYRYLHADQFYFGTSRSTPPPEFFGQPIFITIHTLNFNVSYAATNRLSLRLTVPITDGSQSRFYKDTVRHEFRAGGLGDIALVGTAWLGVPRTHADGNLALGLGVKLPTGNDKSPGRAYNADGSSVPQAVDQSIQQGDGGWGVILETEAFRRVARRAYAYFTGSYLLSPGDQSDVVRQQAPLVYYSISDVYTGRLGMNYVLAPGRGLSVGMGGRIDGIPYHDLIGRNDGFRRPGYAVFIEPRVTLGRGAGTLSLSAPVRVAQRLAKHQQVMNSGGTLGAGDLARVVFFIGYGRRL